MDFFEVIEKRYSHRGPFINAAVPREDIVKILDAGIRAPSGMNYQTTTFIAVTEPGLRAGLHRIVQKPTTETAPLMIVVCTEEVANHDGLVFEREDYGAAVENMLLAVTALGYASVWLDGFTRLEGRAEQIARLLEVEDGKTVRCVLPIGVPAQVGKQKEKRPFEQRAEII